MRIKSKKIKKTFLFLSRSRFQEEKRRTKKILFHEFRRVAPSPPDSGISYYFARTEAFVTRDIGHPEVRGGCVSRIRNFKSSADLDARKAGRVSSGTRELDRSASFLTRRGGRGPGPNRDE